MGIARKKYALYKQCCTPGINCKAKLYLITLHIKLGHIKYFFQALNKSGEGFKYLIHKFPFNGKLKFFEKITWNTFENV